MKKITASVNASAAYAFMDPVAVVDRNSGRIYLFCTRWPRGASTPNSTRAFMCVSNDNGESWTTPSDVTAQIAATDCLVSGFGPGAGFQIGSGTYNNRLIVPTRQYSPVTQLTYINTVYSTDGGNNWVTGKDIRPAGECSMADCGNNKLTLNVRAGGARSVGSSTDGGNTWSAPSAANSGGLPAPGGGCQASVYGLSNGVVFFAGAQGGEATSLVDDRSKLMIFRSIDGAVSWNKKKELWPRACGYTCITQLNDGKIAIIFECGENMGFIKQATRPAGWMRLDIVIIPEEVTQNGYWFE